MGDLPAVSFGGSCGGGLRVIRGLLDARRRGLVPGGTPATALAGNPAGMILVTPVPILGEF